MMAAAKAEPGNSQMLSIVSQLLSIVSQVKSVMGFSLGCVDGLSGHLK